MLGFLKRKEKPDPDDGFRDGDVIASASLGLVHEEADDFGEGWSFEDAPYTMESAPFTVSVYRELSRAKRDEFMPGEVYRLDFTLAGCRMVLNLPDVVEPSAVYRARIAHPERNVGYEWLPEGPDIPGWKVILMIQAAP